MRSQFNDGFMFTAVTASDRTQPAGVARFSTACSATARIKRTHGNERAGRFDDGEHRAEIVRKLRGAGHVAYYAGGSVRDLLRGQVPKDIDIATDARPEAVQKMFSRTYAVGAHFGVIVVLEDGFQFEVATFRSDGAYLDGRRPTEVHFATAEEDAARRDFTINGMFFDPEAR